MHTRHRHLSGACDSLRALLFPLVTLLGSATVCLEAQTPNTSPSTTKPALGAEEPIEMMEFVVKEKGVSRATSTVTTRDVDISLPGASPILLLRNQPGVNITSSDPFGFFSEGGDIRVRAFTIGVLAVTIDGVPMGSNSTRYGTPASRIVDGEDLKSIQVNAGTGDVTTPAFEALGGSIQYFTKAPAPVMSAHLVQTLGSWDYRRTYARFDTGEIQCCPTFRWRDRHKSRLSG